MGGALAGAGEERSRECEERRFPTGVGRNLKTAVETRRARARLRARSKTGGNDARAPLIPTARMFQTLPL